MSGYSLRTRRSGIRRTKTSKLQSPAPRECAFCTEYRTGGEVIRILPAGACLGPVPAGSGRRTVAAAGFRSAGGVGTDVDRELEQFVVVAVVRLY